MISRGRRARRCLPSFRPRPVVGTRLELLTDRGRVPMACAQSAPKLNCAGERTVLPIGKPFGQPSDQLLPPLLLMTPTPGTRGRGGRFQGRRESVRRNTSIRGGWGATARFSFVPGCAALAGTVAKRGGRGGNAVAPPRWPRPSFRLARGWPKPGQNWPCRQLLTKRVELGSSPHGGGRAHLA
jgi:hypothetical protein